VPARIRQFALRPVGAGYSHRPAPPDAWIAIPVPAIISQKIFAAAQACNFLKRDRMRRFLLLSCYRKSLCSTCTGSRSRKTSPAASFFLQRLYREMFGRAEVQQLRNAVIFDEAHRVARLALMPKMMQECRKYGILFVLSSQRIEDFDQGMLDSAGNHLYLRVNHPDARRLASYLAAGGGAGDIAQKLQRLHKYDALYRSEDYQTFAHVRLAEP
jgi:hypothetical protein